MKMEHLQSYRQMGENIRHYRKIRNYTQLKLSEILNLDINHISKIEIGKNAPSLDVIFDISNALEVPVYKLFQFRD